MSFAGNGGQRAALLLVTAVPLEASDVKPRHVSPAFKKGNQYAHHPTNHTNRARRGRHGQDRTLTEVTASLPTFPGTSRPSPRKTNAASQWLPPVGPVGLIVLSLIPVLAGAFRLSELMGGPEITANNARFVASPIPVTVHIVSVTLYSLLGALQFVPSLRRGRSSWHRIAGRMLVPAGVLVAVSGLWMNFF
jgi:hypothetical protein